MPFPHLATVVPDFLAHPDTPHTHLFTTRSATDALLWVAGPFVSWPPFTRVWHASRHDI
jgi:hypothetical protein